MKNRPEDIREIQVEIEAQNIVFTAGAAAKNASRSIDEKYIVLDRKKLPVASILSGGEELRTSNLSVSVMHTDSDVAYQKGLEYLAIAFKLEGLEKEAKAKTAALDKKRDEVYRRLYPRAPLGAGYKSSLTAVQTGINEIVRLEQELDSLKNSK